MREIYAGAQALRDSVPPTATITLVGGSFDLLHIGHLRFFERSKAFADVLVICVLSDQYVKSYKGPTRPIVGQAHRAGLIDGLRCVDRVFISDIDTSHEDTLAIIQPTTVVFGVEDTETYRRTAPKRDRFIRSRFPEVRIEYLERFSEESISTSDLIRRVVSTHESP
ncbi:MAG TPA: adenylyltransferase/cytidyltransferase family protein [Candidatus Paceibacterota bacterium]|jgi:cytidyltransferase-like protein